MDLVLSNKLGIFSSCHLYHSRVFKLLQFLWSKKYYVYECTNKKKHLCNNKDIRKNILESFVISKLKKEILNEESIDIIGNNVCEYVSSAQSKNKDEISRLDKKAKAMKMKIDKAMDLILDGTINSSIINEKINFLNVEFNSCVNKIQDLQHKDMSWISKDKIKVFLIYSKNALDNGDDIEKQKIMSTFLDKVLISKDNIEINFKIDFTTPQMESGKVGGGEPFKSKFTMNISDYRHQVST